MSQLSIKPQYSGVNIENYYFLHAAISPDGKYPALSADSWGIYGVELVEISSGDILFSLDYRIDGVRWRNP